MGVPFVARLVAVVLVFVLPMGMYYWAYSPFGVRCKYRPPDKGSRPDFMAEELGFARIEPDGTAVRFDVGIGGTVDDYELRFESSEKVELRMLDKEAEHHQFDRQTNVFFSPKRDPRGFVLSMLVTPVDSELSAGRTHRLDVYDHRTDRELETVNLLPK